LIGKLKMYGYRTGRQICRYCAVNDRLGVVQFCCCSNDEARLAAFVEEVDVSVRTYIQS